MPEAEERFPWARPRFEVVLLVLVAFVALSPIVAPESQDKSHLCLTEALLHGNVSNDACLAGNRANLDISSYGGHRYSNKAPGLSVLAVPAVAVLQPGRPQTWSIHDMRVWGVRVLTVGLSLLVCAFLVGRVSEGLAPGFGAAALVTFSLGTIIAALAGVSFEHVPAAALGFGAFLLAWKKRPALAGLAGGGALLVAYENAVILAAIAGYLVLEGWRPLRSYVVGLVPGAVLLGAYDWAAFGAPWHLSYRYDANQYAFAQAQGFFGIRIPYRIGIYMVFSGNGGLLVISPVLALAALGLIRLGRSYRAEAIVAAFVTAAFVFMVSGYFKPYGGLSPGPRVLAPAVPFLALGLAPAFRWLPRLTAFLAALSVIAGTAVTLDWSTVSPWRGGVWAELVRTMTQGDSARLIAALPPSALTVIGVGPGLGGLLVAICAAAAFAIGLYAMPWAEIRARGRQIAERTRPRLALVASVGGCLALIGAANALAIDDPYDLDATANLHTQISSSPSTVSYVGSDTNFRISVTDQSEIGVGQIALTIQLSPAMHLAGRPIVTRGPGCTGTDTLHCDLGFLTPNDTQTALVYLGVRFTAPGNQKLAVTTSGVIDPIIHHTSVTIEVGT
jgi:hypothetical protein